MVILIIDIPWLLGTMDAYELTAIAPKASIGNGTYWTETDPVTESGR
jgi:hypothetical protein